VIGLPRAETRRQIAPGRAGAQDPQDRLEAQARIRAASSAAFGTTQY
jgi:hypothetical protein